MGLAPKCAECGRDCHSPVCPDCWPELAAWRGRLRLVLGMEPLQGDLGDYKRRVRTERQVVWWDSWGVAR